MLVVMKKKLKIEILGYNKMVTLPDPDAKLPSTAIL